MDLRKFKVTLGPDTENLYRPFDIEADDVVVVEGFVMFVLLTDDGNVDKTIAMFNQNQVQSVIEETKND